MTVRFLTDKDKQELQENIDGIAQSPVQFVPQTLTEEQKEQARENIGAAKHKEYVLVRSMTALSDSVLTCVVSTDNNSNPFSLSDVFIRITLPKVTATVGVNLIMYDSAGKRVYGFSVTMGSTSASQIVRVWANKRPYGYDVMRTLDAAAQFPTDVNSVSNEFITKVNLSSYNNPYPEGTVIELWGVREDA